MILHRYIASGESRSGPRGARRLQPRFMARYCGFTTAPRSEERRTRLSVPPNEAVRRVPLQYSGRDSDLEAFSHNPPDGSVAPLAVQPST